MPNAGAPPLLLGWLRPWLDVNVPEESGTMITTFNAMPATMQVVLAIEWTCNTGGR